MASLVALAGRQQGRARPPLRRVGGERADARVGGRRRRDGAGRARPRALDLPGAQGARRRAPRTASRAARAAWRCSTTSCPTGRVHRRQPARRRRADHVRRRLRRQLGDADGPARAQDPPGGGLAPRPRRGVGAAAVPRGPASATRWSRACEETWAQAGRWLGPDDDPGLPRGARAGDGEPRRPRHSASRCARGWPTCSPPRASDHRARRADRLVGLGPRARAGRREDRR